MEELANLTRHLPMTLENLGEGLRYFDGPALRDLASYRNGELSSFCPPHTDTE
jgi:hypothetical protein